MKTCLGIESYEKLSYPHTHYVPFSTSNLSEYDLHTSIATVVEEGSILKNVITSDLFIMAFISSFCTCVKHRKGKWPFRHSSTFEISKMPVLYI